MNYLRRYTDLPTLLHLLIERELTFLDPSRWDDKNDAFYMEKYREFNALRTLLALCFTQAPETYHHWRVFCSGPSGVCLYFDHNRLVGLLRKRMAIRRAMRLQNHVHRIAKTVEGIRAPLLEALRIQG